MKTTPDSRTIDLNQRDLNVVTQILTHDVPEYAVWAFGSRVSGTAKPYSDLDLVILADKPLSIERMATIKDDFAESDLPIRVDVVDWASASAAFREIIRQNYLVIQQGAASNLAGM